MACVVELVEPRGDLPPAPNADVIADEREHADAFRDEQGGPIAVLPVPHQGFRPSFLFAGDRHSAPVIFGSLVRSVVYRRYPIDGTHLGWELFPWSFVVFYFFIERATARKKAALNLGTYIPS